MSVVKVYSKTNADATFIKIVNALPTGKSATDTVTFQDLIDMGIIVLPNP